jgi:HAD superfamily phosphoserine phosphatase-like hydrolase
MRKIAFFDFDNTIYNGYTYQDFIDYVSENVLKTDKFQIKSSDIIKNTKNYNDIVLKKAEIVGEMITGWTQSEFEKYGKVSCNKSKILEWVVPVINFLKSVGFETIIITSSFKEMLSDSVEALKIDREYYSSFETENDKYNGKIKLLLNDDKKVEAIKEEIKGDNTFSIAFGDSMGDAPMLDTVNLAFLVRSYNTEIEDIAKQKGWFLGSNPEEIIDEIQKNIK